MTTPASDERDVQPSALDWADRAHDALEYYAPNHPCVDEYASVRARLASLESREAGWRDIATAPKDGTWLLVWNGHWRGVARYRSADEDDGPCYWVDESGEWVTPDPTHWMPLPAPPSPAEPAGGEGTV